MLDSHLTTSLEDVLRQENLLQNAQLHEGGSEISQILFRQL